MTQFRTPEKSTATTQTSPRKEQEGPLVERRRKIGDKTRKAEGEMKKGRTTESRSKVMKSPDGQKEEIASAPNSEDGACVAGSGAGQGGSNTRNPREKILGGKPERVRKTRGFGASGRGPDEMYRA